jgi:hypothetical protein
MSAAGLRATRDVDERQAAPNRADLIHPKNGIGTPDAHGPTPMERARLAGELAAYRRCFAMSAGQCPSVLSFTGLGSPVRGGLSGRNSTDTQPLEQLFISTPFCRPSALSFPMFL